MTATHQLVYFIFAIVLVVALILDLGLLSKKNKTITIKQALYQTLFWVALAIGFFVFVWIEEGQKTGLEYLSAYLMEWSLSVDNIFVFVIILSRLKIEKSKRLLRIRIDCGHRVKMACPVHAGTMKCR